jgi:choline dehydrogenase-like flavoprotein
VLQNGNEITSHSKLTTQICIVGGGVAGIVLANELQDHFENIILVESGDINYQQTSQDLYQVESFPYPLPNPHYSRLRFLGGSSNHWQNNTSPLDPIDFEYREWIPNSGWPISFKDLSPYYIKAQYYCGVAEGDYQTKYWSTLLNKNDLVAHSKTLETRIAKSAIPPVRFFDRYGKNLTTAKNIQVIANSNLVDIEYDKQTQKILSITLANNKGNNFTVHADTFVMGLGGIENARMLLAFNEKYSNQLGNQGNKVGRYFMEHPTPRAAHLFTNNSEIFDFYQASFLKNKSVVGFFSLSSNSLEQHKTTNLRIPLIPASEYTISDGISSSHIMGQALSKFTLPNNTSSHIYNILADMDMVLEAVARKKFDATLFEGANDIGGFEMPIMMEQTPTEDNRIRLGKEKDKLGIPKIIIDYKITDADKNRLWRSLEVIAQEVGVQSLGRLKLLRNRSKRIWHDQLGFSNHHMGTTRMSASPDKGVVDSYQRVFGTKNLYISGSSVFSTGGHVPPTLTIVAMTIRLAEHIKNG